MYTPKHFMMNELEEIHEFIHQNSFAILVSLNDGKLVASHLPILLHQNEGGKGFLYGHMAKANMQRQEIGEEVLVIFPGAHKYISPTWYESGQAVPTWNYLSVHVYGKITILDDRDDKEKIVKETVKYFEGDESKYSTEELKEYYFEAQLRGITAFKIEITEIEGKKKLSQNHTEERQQRVISSLESIGDENSKEISERMKKNIKKND